MLKKKHNEDEEKYAHVSEKTCHFWFRCDTVIYFCSLQSPKNTHQKKTNKNILYVVFFLSLHTHTVCVYVYVFMWRCAFVIAWHILPVGWRSFRYKQAIFTSLIYLFSLRLSLPLFLVEHHTQSQHRITELHLYMDVGCLGSCGFAYTAKQCRASPSRPMNLSRYFSSLHPVILRTQCWLRSNVFTVQCSHSVSVHTKTKRMQTAQRRKIKW